MNWIARMAVCIGAAVASGRLTEAAVTNRLTADVRAGAGVSAGRMTYEIGGDYRQGGEEGSFHFPISRLEWPLNVPVVEIGGRVTLDSRWELHGTWSGNAEGDAGTVKNSDWELEDSPDTLTVYSESDAVVEGWEADAGARWWVNAGDTMQDDVRFAVGLGLRRQSVRWEARDLDQTYPQEPELGHVYASGLVGTYEATVDFPYLEAAVEWRLRWIQLFGRLAYSPLVRVEDVDDHVLRAIRAEAEGDGQGMIGEGRLRYVLGDGWFLDASGRILLFQTEGTEENRVYGGDEAGSTWEIEHNVTSTQGAVTLAAGYSF